jgi:hypothetical protein
VSQFQSLPTYDQPITIGPNTASVWYRFFQGLFQGKAAGGEVSVTLTGSPFSYAAPSGGFLIVQGGTVSLIQFQRSSAHALGVTQGVVPVNAQDIVIITYSAAPTVTFVPG